MTAPAKATAMPVFPDVASIRVDPYLSKPLDSSSYTILRPILSFVEPPGLKNSHLASTSHSIPSLLVMLFNLIIGVFPM